MFYEMKEPKLAIGHEAQGEHTKSIPSNIRGRRSPGCSPAGGPYGWHSSSPQRLEEKSPRGQGGGLF